MQCPVKELSTTEEYLNDFYLRAARRHVPLSGSLELTCRCNLKCIHCYLGGNVLRGKRQLSEMSTARVLSLLDEITEAGCLNLLITGGEPLLRDDFPEIYRRAKEKGLLVTVFSNGTLVADRIVELFREFPPFEVEISLYGATAGTYEKVTGVRGSYEKCMEGVKTLLDKNIRVNLKTVLMTLNRHELSEMENIARKLGVRFRFDAAISPRIDGDRTPLALRISPEDAIEDEFSDPDRLELWKNYFQGVKENLLTDDLYGCRAGITGFHIDPYGRLQPCMMMLDIQRDVSEGGFVKEWNEVAAMIRKRKAGPEFSCRGCEKVNLCGYCPSFFMLENGAEDDRSEYLCRMGELRYERVVNPVVKGENHDREERGILQTAL